MNEMIERCRMALKSKIVSVALRDKDYDEALIAVIKAMREPTQEMVDAALATQDIYTGRGSLARIGYQAMIDEILK